jgi:hypothetical protein
MLEFVFRPERAQHWQPRALNLHDHEAPKVQVIGQVRALGY